MKKILVSVIVPVYNVENYIRECIVSILNQTMIENLQVIIVNDGSSDNSISNIEDLLNHNKDRITLINQKNLGVSAARNKGVEYACGDYIYFIDSDDYIENNYIEILYNYAIKYDLDISVATFKDEHKVKSLSNKISVLNEVVSGSDYMFNEIKSNKMDVVVFDKMYKKSFLNSNNIKFKENIIFEDNLFYIETFLKAKKVSFLNEDGYIYRKRPDSITTSKLDHRFLSSWNIIVDELLKIYNTLDDDKDKKSVSMLLSWSLPFRAYFIENNDKKYRKEMYRSLQKKQITKIMIRNVNNYREYIKYICYKYTFRTYIKLIRIYEQLYK